MHHKQAVAVADLLAAFRRALIAARCPVGQSVEPMVMADGRAHRPEFLEAGVELTTRRPMARLHAGLDLSRKRLDVLNEQSGTVQVTQAPPDAGGLRGLARPDRRLR
jgi:hypothetical protein